MSILTTVALNVSEETVAKLAAELAANLRPAADIVRDAGLSVAEFKLLSATPQFRVVFQEAKKLWHADTNTNERIRTKALLALENMLIEVVRMVNDPDTSAASKLEGVKVTTKLAGMEKQTPAEDGGSKFSVTINIPGTPSRTIEAEKIEVDDDD